jgi:branched-chain amino acid transport system permease protein
MDVFLGTLIQGLLMGGVYAVIALGVVVIYKSSKVFNIAHGEILMLFAYLMWWLLVSLDLPLWLSSILVLLACILLGLSLERLLFRRLVGRSMLITFMFCLFLGKFVNGVAILSWGGYMRTMPHFIPAGNLVIGGISFSHSLLWSFIVAMTMFLIFFLYFRFSKMGLQMRAVAEDHVVSESVGVDVHKIFALSWIIGCVSAAVGGILLGSVFFVETGMGNSTLMKALPVLLLGGMESVPGALIGGLIVGVAQNMSVTYADIHMAGFSELLPIILIVLVLLIRPSGLFGLKIIERI